MGTVGFKSSSSECKFDMTKPLPVSTNLPHSNDCIVGLVLSQLIQFRSMNVIECGRRT